MMSKKVKIGIGSLIAVLLLSTALVGAAFAQDSTQAPSRAPARAMGPMGGRSMLGEAGLEAVAGILGMTPEELSAELWGGRTLAELADAAGVELLTLQEAVQAANEQARQDAIAQAMEEIEQAVEDGKLSRERADWMLEGLENGYIGGLRGIAGKLGRMRDRGFGGMGLFGMSDSLGAAPFTSSTPL
jgi:hypothetical protein